MTRVTSSKRKPTEIAPAAGSGNGAPTGSGAAGAERAWAAPAPSKPTPYPPDPTKSIRIRGAREHNLKSVDVDIPRDRLVVISGLSGSGKSSLAFDTIFAE